MYELDAMCVARLVHVLRVARATPARSPPPYSSSTTSRFPLGFSHDRGTWYLQCQCEENAMCALREETRLTGRCTSHVARHGCFYVYVPSLGQVAAVGHALVLAVRPGVAAPPAAAGVGPVRPEPPGVVPVHPHLALAHAAHVQSHRIAPRRHVEQGLRVTPTRIFSNTSHLSLLPSLHRWLMERPCAKSVAACRRGKPIPRQSFQSQCGGRATRLSGQPAGHIQNSV